MRKGLQRCIAKCSKGDIGLITSETLQKVTYPDGSTCEAWTGIHVSKEKFGQPWSSRNPTYLGDFDELLRILFDAWKMISL